MAIVNGYAQLEDLKALLRIPASDTVDDAQLSRAIEAASRRIDGVCDRIFYQEANRYGEGV
jgi:phage gp36-like protein